MYSVVLMAALATGGSAPAFHHGGCHGCYGGCYGCYGGCYGYYGGCYGCYGGCYGCHGCWGGCYGCYGGCWGGCYGGYSCCGCYGGYSWNGGYSFTDSAPTYMPPVGGPEKVAPPEGADKKGNGKGKKGDSDKKGMEDEAAADSAKLIVELPDKAKLFVDDRLVKNAFTRRTFTTPKLEKGHAYYYILRAEVVRDGKTQSESKRIIVRPGEVVRASFTDLTHDATAKADTKP
ncbi:MAG TPA: TIGR03000 domain-containing protein [Gemmataceae bacterium]|jgi:uncharacterized protein (TIGR03000 family)|nr:TIGR03000 domain-containing protein [Gemmataceae bacterium]